MHTEKKTIKNDMASSRNTNTKKTIVSFIGVFGVHR